MHPNTIDRDGVADKAAGGAISNVQGFHAGSHSHSRSEQPTAGNLLPRHAARGRHSFVFLSFDGAMICRSPFEDQARFGLIARLWKISSGLCPITPAEF